MKGSLCSAFLAGIGVIVIGTGSAWAAGYAARAAAFLAKGEPRAAAIELRNAVKQNPADAAAHFELGQIDLSLGDAVSAEREARAAQAHGYDPGKALSLLLETYLAQARYKDLLHDFPAGNPDPELAARIAVGRGRAEIGLNQIAQAAADFATARHLAPHQLGPLLAEEDLELAQHHFTAAWKSLAAAQAINPHSKRVLLHEAARLLATGNTKAALAVLERLKTAAPGDPAVRLQLANALIAAGEDAKAGTEVKTALAMVPGSVEGIYLQALLLMRSGHPHQAYALLLKLSPVMGRVPEAYLLQAVTLEHLGQWAAAQGAAQQFLGHFPNDPRGVRVLTAIALHQGQPKAALAALEALPAAERSDPESLDLLARAHAETGDLSAAATEFAAAAKLAPKFEAPHTGLAAVRLTEGDLQGAIREYEKALALAPGDAAARRALIAAAISAGQFELADANLAILGKAEPASVPDALLRAQLRIARLDLAGAKATYKGILKTNPHTVAALLGLAQIAALQGNVKTEQKNLNAVLAQDPTNAVALASLTTLLISQGKEKDARALLERLHGLAPDNTSITADLATLDIRTKRAGDALDLLSATNVGTDPTLLDLEAQAELQLGKKAAAADTLKTLLAHAPGAVGVRLTLARLLVSEKDYAGARRTLNDGLAQNPGNLALLQGLVGVTLAEHGPAAAAAEARRLAADPSYLPAARALPGDFAISQHQPAAAAKAYAAALAAEPSATLALRLSQALLAAGKTKQAADSLRAYLARYPDAAPVSLALASIEIGQGQLDQAVTHLKKVIQAEPNNAAALNNLAWIRSKQGKPEALQLAERAYFLARSPNIADTLGWIITQKKPDPTGLALLQAAHAAAPTDPSIAYHLAAALVAAGQNKAAAALLRPIVSGPAKFADKAAAGALLHKLAPNP